MISSFLLVPALVPALVSLLVSLLASLFVSLLVSSLFARKKDVCSIMISWFLLVSLGFRRLSPFLSPFLSLLFVPQTALELNGVLNSC